MIITLASASPRRRELIKRIDGLSVDVCPSDADENISAPDPVTLVKELALIKARAVLDKRGGVVVGADTIVTIDGLVLGKPKTRDEADEFFRLLCGREHEVITGIAVVSENKTVSAAEITRVSFKPYDKAVVDAYIASGSPFDKAGGYGIQDQMLTPLVDRVVGSMDNVIGLPVELLRITLKEF